jgi:hypothetical protein
MDFTSQQLHAIDSGIPIPVNIEGRECVLVPERLYVRFREAIEDWHPASMERHMAQMMADDWSDPAMNVYDE